MKRWVISFNSSNLLSQHLHAELLKFTDPSTVERNMNELRTDYQNKGIGMYAVRHGGRQVYTYIRSSIFIKIESWQIASQANYHQSPDNCAALALPPPPVGP